MYGYLHMAEKVPGTEGRSHHQTKDQSDMQDAEVVREVQEGEENVKVQAENKTKGKDEMQAGDKEERQSHGKAQRND